MQFENNNQICFFALVILSLKISSECSQKLIIWKQDENKRKKRDKRKNSKVNNIPKIIVTSEKPLNIDYSKKIRKKK